MRTEDLVKALIGYNRITVHDFTIEKDCQHPDEDVFVARIALMEEEQYCCPKCGQKCGKYDRPKHVKRWRSLDLGQLRFYIECLAPRCICPDHGVYVQKFPWAFPGSDYTKAFETRVAYMAAKTPTNIVSKQFRVKWGTVGRCVRRVQEQAEPAANRFHKMKKIAIDETSYRKGHKYITVVQNLETSEVIWAHDGYGDEVLKIFFEHLTQDQRDGIEYVAADGAKWITRQVEHYCPHAVRCIDPFHVVGWATENLDKVRKRLSTDVLKKDLPS